MQLMARLATALWRMPAAGATVGSMSLAELRARYPVTTVDVGDTPLEIVRTGGDGAPPLVMLPGAQGTAEVYYRQLLEWGGRRDVVSVTYPALTDAAAIADAVVALAERLGLGQVDLVGTSLGGFVAQHVAARHPARIGRLVLGNTFADPAPAQSPDKLQALEGRTAAAVKADALARVAASPESELKRVQLDLIGERQSAELLQSRMLAVQRARAVGAIGVPDARILVVECDDDPLIPPPMRAALRAAHPQARSVVIEGGGHYPYIVRAEAYNAAVGAFLGLA